VTQGGRDRSAGETGSRPEILSASTWADRVAALLADRLAARPELVVCLPTGSTPLPVYERLPSVLAARDVSAAHATVVLLDEYLGLRPGHPARCDALLGKVVVDRLRPARTIVFDVDQQEPAAACAAFDRDIAAVGGLDLVVLGLGRNGHIGMNEPGSAPNAPTRVIGLAPSTREAAIRYGADPPPTHGVTLGMAGILATPEIWLLATGAEKAGILAATLDGPVTPEVPASLLRDHPGLRIIVDDAAARSVRSPGPS